MIFVHLIYKLTQSVSSTSIYFQGVNLLNPTYGTVHTKRPQGRNSDYQPEGNVQQVCSSFTVF